MAKLDYVIAAYPRAAGKAGRHAGVTGGLAAAEVPAVAVALGGLVDVEEDAADVLVIGAASAV